MRIRMRLLLVGVLGLTAVPFAATPAGAACNVFAVDSDASVKEGDRITVEVERIGTQTASSSVRLRTVDGSAEAPEDYTEFDKRITFVGDQKKKTVEIKTNEDSTHEATESVRFELLEGDGCNDANDFDYQPRESTSFIYDDDPDTDTPAPAPSTTTPGPAGTGSPSPSPSASPTGSPTATPSETPTASPSPSPTPSSFPLVEEEDEGFPILPVLAVAGFLIAGAGALLLTRMRRAGL